MMASTSPGRACPLIPSRIFTSGAPRGPPPATVTRTSSHVRDALGSSPASATADDGTITTACRPRPPHAKTPLARDHRQPPPLPQPGCWWSVSGVPPPQRHSGCRGLGVGAHRGNGIVHEKICELPALVNFSFAYNFFNSEAAVCMPSDKAAVHFDDRDNCLGALRPAQKTALQCAPVLARPVDCSKHVCAGYPTKPPAEPSKPSEPEKPPKEPEKPSVPLDSAART